MPIRIVAGLVMTFVALAAQGATLYSCPFVGGGDQLTRGFYVTGFPAATLDSITLQYIGGPAGTYNVTVTARTNAYNGPVVGSATQNVNIASGGGTAVVTFNLGGTAVPAGSTVTFTQTLNSGPGTLFYDTGVGPCANITETEGVTPPLDLFRRDSIGLTIAGTLGITPAAQAVPALGEGALAALALLMAAAAGMTLRRSRSAGRR